MEVIADIPGVGQNLQDHLGVFGLTWTVRQGSLPLLGTSLSPDAVKSYVKTRGGECSFSVDVDDWAAQRGMKRDWNKIVLRDKVNKKVEKISLST